MPVLHCISTFEGTVLLLKITINSYHFFQVLLFLAVLHQQIFTAVFYTFLQDSIQDYLKKDFYHKFSFNHRNQLNIIIWNFTLLLAEDDPALKVASHIMFQGWLFIKKCIFSYLLGLIMG